LRTVAVTWGAARAAELDRGGPDAARGAVDEQALARAEAGLGEQRVVRGREHLGQAAGGGPVQALGHGHELALVDDAALGLPAAAHDRHHPVAGGEAPGAGPERLDLAGELQAGDVGRRAGGRGVGAAALQHVRAVQPGAADPDEDLAVTGARGSGFSVTTSSPSLMVAARTRTPYGLLP
jgi:hypothetical protein